jgi:formylglycine-generating enzyme required for sulfatase activity/DNA-binding NarL/FixJ family response regulator
MRVLLVDDDTSVIQSLLPILRSEPGLEVRAATNAAKALENAATLGGIDLLITDVVMQPMDGFALRDEITRRYPGARTVFISGYDLSEYADKLGRSQLLPKPVDPDTLRAAIQHERAGGGAAVAATNHAASRAEVEQMQMAAGGGGPSAPPPASSGWHSGESLIGHTLGAYQIVSQLGEGRWGTVYAAVQTSINRPVGLKVLDGTRQQDPAAKARFIADARAKAHAQHPSILSVYEAGEADGRIFYTHEYVDGQNLVEVLASGRKLDEAAILKVLRMTAEGLAYLQTRSVPHTTLDASNIYLGVDGTPRLSNIATQFAEFQIPVDQEIQVLGRIILSVAQPVQQLSPGLRALLGRMVQGGPNAFAGWGALLQAIKALEPKVVPVEAAKISAADRAAIEAVEAARRQQKRSLWLTVATMTLTLAAVMWVVWFYVFRSNERMLETQVLIPAGDYIVGADAELVHLDAFSIDKYEVTIGQYANFLTYLEQHPTSEQDFNHPRQPRYLEHRPKDWAIYYGRAKAGRPVHGVPTDLNSPMMMVTWWDAYAYAKWKGRELPTEQQWEAAARGPKGFIYPWGDEMDPKKVNSNADYDAAHPGAVGNVDGFNFWSPVDAITSDRSPFDVVGLAGNVSEWVATWTPDNRFPVLKGGNFTSADVRLDKRYVDRDASKPEEFIGFRTVSNKPAQTTK